MGEKERFLSYLKAGGPSAVLMLGVACLAVETQAIDHHNLVNLGVLGLALVAGFVADTWSTAVNIKKYGNRFQELNWLLPAKYKGVNDFIFNKRKLVLETGLMVMLLANPEAGLGFAAGKALVAVRNVFDLY